MPRDQDATGHTLPSTPELRGPDWMTNRSKNNSGKPAFGSAAAQLDYNCKGRIGAYGLDMWICGCMCKLRCKKTPKVLGQGQAQCEGGFAAYLPIQVPISLAVATDGPTDLYMDITE